MGDRRLSAKVEDTAETVGGKAHGLVVLHRLGLPVPAGFVVTEKEAHVALSTG